MPSLGGDPVGISGWNLYRKQERGGATVWWKLHDLNFDRFRLIHPCDGRTDGFAIAYSVLSMLSRADTRKLCYRKDDRAMRPIYDPLKFSGLPDYAHGYYSQHFLWAFVLIHFMNVPSKFEIRSFTRSWNNRGYPKNLCSPWIRPRSLFSKIINGLLFGLAL